jgi:hypothetical protein
VKSANCIGEERERNNHIELREKEKREERCAAWESSMQSQGREKTSVCKSKEKR